jgi:hypothetical protein
MGIKTSCIICSKSCRNGIIIKGKLICSQCEKKILSSNVDTDFYEYYKNQIKKNLSDILVEESVESEV